MGDFKTETVRSSPKYRAVKDRLVDWIRSNEFYKIKEAITTFYFTQEEEPYVKLLSDDKDVKHIFEVKKIMVMSELRSELIKKVKKGDNRAIETMLKLVADDETLARLAGGGLKLLDVKEIESQGRRNIIIETGSDRARMLDVTSSDGIVPADNYDSGIKDAEVIE